MILRFWVDNIQCYTLKLTATGRCLKLSVNNVIVIYMLIYQLDVTINSILVELHFLSHSQQIIYDFE